MRDFQIVDGEGEIYQVNTSVKGKFYGSVWTRILSCYESRQPLRGRLTKPVYDESDQQIGFQIKIGNVTAFLPLNESFRSEKQPPINTLVTVTHIDPIRQKVTVSSQVAYDNIFANAPILVLNEKTKGLCWQYDDNYLYFLLPHKYMGLAPYTFTCITDAEKLMGTIVDLQVESIKRREKEALVSIINDPSDLLEREGA